MSDTPTPEQIVDEFVRRLTSHDLDGALELMADDVEYDNVPLGKNLGKEATRTFLAAMDGADEVVFVTHRQVAAGVLVLNERTDRFRIGDKWMDLPVAGVFEVRDGLITLWRDYFDMATFNSEMAKISG